jgi:hypothetical protein
MNIKTSWKLAVMLSLVALLSLAAIGVAYGANSAAASLCNFNWAYSNDDGAIGRPSGFSSGIDPDDNGNDPQSAQTPGASALRGFTDSASTAAGYTLSALTFNLNNAYPGYSPTIFFGLSNQWATPGYVQSIVIQNPYPDLLTVKLNGLALNQLIAAGAVSVGYLSVAVGDVPPGGPNDAYSLSLAIGVSQSIQSAPAMAINTLTLADGTVRSGYWQTLTGSHGNTPYTWSLASGSLPPGLTLDPVSGLISGSPRNAGTYTFSITMTDSTGDSVTAGFTIRIYLTSSGGSGGATLPTPSPTTPAASQTPAPDGGTAEIPPAGGTAEHTPTPAVTPQSTPAGALIEPTTPAAVTTGVPSAVTTTPLVTESTLTGNPQSPANAGGTPPVASSNWLLIAGIIIVVIVIIGIWWFEVLYRRRRKSEKKN